MKEKKELFWNKAALITRGIAIVLFIVSMWCPKDIWWKVWVTGLITVIASMECKQIEHEYAIMYLKEDIRSISYAINQLAENVREELYGTDEEPEEDTKEAVIVSPEDFERFSRGEMTKEELLGIKKAIDKVTEAKTKAS